MESENIIETLLQTEEKQYLNISIKELGLSNRVRQSLLRGHISTVGRLVKRWNTILGIQNLGPKSRMEVLEKLNAWHLTAKKSPSLDDAYVQLNLAVGEKVSSEQQEIDEPLLDDIEYLANIPIEELDISIRAYNALKRKDINTVVQIYQQWDKICLFKNVGPATRADIRTALASLQIPINYKKTRKERSSSTDSLVPTNDEDQTIQQSSDPEPNLSDLPIELLNLPVEALELPSRAYNALKRSEIHTVVDFYRALSKEDFIRGIGPFMLGLIQSAIDSWNTNYQEVHHSATSTPSDLGSADDKSLITKPIYHLKLPGALLALLKKNSIHRIHQLTTVKLEELRYERVINYSQKVEIQNAIQVWLDKDPLRQENYQEGMRYAGFDALPIEIDFEDYFNALIDSIDTRWISILEFRYGLRTGETQTLEETAAYLGVTRERVRQIETLALKKIESRTQRLFQSQLFEKIQANIDQRGGFISETRLIEELSNALKLRTYSMKGILRFIRKIFAEEIKLLYSQTRIRYLGTLQGWTTNHWDEEQILHASQKMIDILSNAGVPMQWSDLYTALIHEDELISLDEHLAHAVALGLSDTQRIYRQLDGSWSKSKRPSRQARIIFVMKELGQPAHFTEITERYNQVYGDQPLAEHAVHGILSGREEFVRVGRGKYGLKEWGLHDDGNIANAVRRILTCYNHPMDISDITDEVLKTWEVSKGSVLVAIEVDARFSKTGEGKIWLTEWGLKLEKRIKRDDESRVDRLYSILKEYGEPVSVQEIVVAHNKAYFERPLTVASGKQLMYRKKDLFTFIGSERFALAEWGLEAVEEQLRDRKKEIIDIINEHGPIHINDLYALYNQRNIDSPISRNTLLMYLSKLRHLLSRPQRGVYELRALTGENG